MELRCDARDGYFAPKPELSWVFNGSKVVPTDVTSKKTFRYNLSQEKGNLRIENISEGEYGVYQCVATMDSGCKIISKKAWVRMSCKYHAGGVLCDFSASFNITC